MDEERRARGILFFAIFWIAVAGGLFAAYKYWWAPRKGAELEEATGSKTVYKHRVALRLDAFSGYAVLRSSVMAKLLREEGIKLEIEDDKADYAARMAALKDGKAQLAVFTIDSQLKAGIALGSEMPGTIVLVIDQTKGADAIVAYKTGLRQLQDLDHKDARFWFTPNSPSEFLARIVVGQLTLPNLPDTGWYKEADGAADVLAKLRAADPKGRNAFVLWEPYVSEALKVPNTHVLFDSGKCTNCVVDVLVARREFLAEHPDVMKAIVESYFRALHSHEERTDGMVELVMEDAKAGGEPLTRQQAEKVVAGIEWKNVMENYAHFGVERGGLVAGIQPLEDIIEYVGRILVRTGGVSSNPYKGSANRLYYDAIVRQLHDQQFHPGKKENLVEGFGPGAADLSKARVVAELPALADAEWAKLMPVGNARVEPIGFNRGTADIGEFSQEDLNALSQQLVSWSQYYLRVVGQARQEGDAAANAQLAKDRANAVVQYLAQRGVSASRLKAESAPPKDGGGSAEVAFVLLQKAY